MECLNDEIRDREKTMRGLKTKDTAILTGDQLFHNYLRPHEALDGKTPTEACGIQIEGQNKWKTHSKCRQKLKLSMTYSLFVKSIRRKETPYDSDVDETEPWNK
jgi:hypothetical protein